MIAIVDYGMGNLRSIQYKLNKFNVDAIVSSDPKEIEKADKLILPGVGHFGKGMENLKKKGLVEILRKKVIEDKAPVMGICLGVQLFTKHSEEGDAEGLGWIDAYVKKFDFSKENNNFRVPHVGWNKVKIAKKLKCWPDFSDDKRFYFTHSYYIECNDKEDVGGVSHYGHDFVSIIEKNNIFGTQFHPEKSHRDGFGLLMRFAEATC